MRLPTRILRTIAAVAAIALLAVAVIACGDDDDDDGGAVADRSRPVQEAAATQAAAAEAAATEAAATAAPSRARPVQEAAATQAASESSSSGAQEVDYSSEPAQPQRASPPDTDFKNYGRTPYVDTSEDAVSTFSLDTDRTSYFLALNWVQNGYVVEPDSVRAEEWINAFSYGYDLPRRDDSFGHHERRPGAPPRRRPAPRPHRLPGAEGARRHPPERDARARRLRVHGRRQPRRHRRAAAEAIRESLTSRDRIAVVHFTTEVIRGLTVEHSRPDDDDVAWSISQLTPNNSTNVQAGLNLGVRRASSASRERPDAFNYIILMSDGVANVDATNPFAILESSPDTNYRNPLRLITIGVGIENYNDVLLEQLAQHGNGWYRYFDDTAQARETFSRENWVALSTPFADQTRAQVTWDPRLVSSWRIVGYENRITPDHTFEQNRREFAEIPSGSATTVFYELVLFDRGRGGSDTLGNVEVRWVDPVSGTSLTQSAPVSGRTDAPFDAGDRHLRFGSIVALASDRYSALSPQVQNASVDYGGIYEDLAALQAELDSLEDRLGSTQAFRDFSFVLDQLTARAEELSPDSGYSQ